MTNINNTENGKWIRRLPVLISTTVLIALLVALGLAYIRANVERNHAITARKYAWRQCYLARTETDDAKREIYRYEISETTHLLEKEKWAEALALLNTLNPDFRGWECGLLMNRASVELFTLCKYPNGPCFVSCSPDGKRLASANENCITIWDALTRKALMKLHGDTNTIDPIAFSPDGKRLASAGAQGVKLWDPVTGKMLLTIDGDSKPVISVAFSPDGNRLASGSDNDPGGNAVQIWDTAINREQLRITVKPYLDDDRRQMSWVNSVAISPDNKRLAAGDNNKMITIWDTTAGKELLRFTGHSETVEHVAFSPDGKRLASVAYGGSVKLWNSFTGEELATLDGYSDWVRSIAFSLDGKQLAVGSRDGTIKIRNAVTGDEQITLKCDAYVAGSVTFSADGTRLASLGSYRHRGIAVKIWDTVTGLELQTFEETFLDVRRGPDLIALSPDGQRLVWASWRGLWLWDAVTGTKLFGFKGHGGDLQSVAFSPDGKRLVSGSESWGDWKRTIRIWDTMSGKELLSLDGRGDVLSLTFSPDGKLLASGNSRNTVTIWKTLDWTKPPK